MQAASSAPTRAASRRARFERAVGRAALVARGLGRRLGAREQRALDVGGLALLRDELLGVDAGALERDELALELGLVVGGEALELGLERRDPLAARPRRRRCPPSSSRTCLERRRARGRAARCARRGRRRASACARGEARCARPPSAPGTRAGRAPRAARCGRPAPRRPAWRRAVTSASCASASSRAARAAVAACRRRAEVRAPCARDVAHELPARLDRLALEALVQLGGLRLALERPQPRARLALDVERAIEVVLRALELELRAPAALAVLAEPGGLLDEQPALARLGGHDRLDAALRDDRVHLLAEAGVGEDLEHVDEPAARAVEAVLALAVAVEAAHDRDLAQRDVDRAVGVVDDDLDLGRRARLHAAAAAEDDVAHRLAADGERRLLAHRPQDGVGDVRLARAVRADDDRDAGAEVELRAVGEGLEALEGQRLEVHRAYASGSHSSSSSGGSGASGCSVSSAIRAASCSACFFERPAPRPTGAPADGRDDLERAVVRRARLGRRPRTRRSPRGARGAPGAST